MENRIYSDLDLNFTKHPITKDVGRKTKENAVIQSVKNLINTNYNERPFNPGFGSGIKGLLFEHVDDLTGSTLSKLIGITIGNYEPRVKINDIQCVPDSDNNRYDVTIIFYILNSTKPITVNFYLNRLR